MTFESRRSLWVILLVVSAAAALTAAWLFPRALPFLNVELDMSRASAMAAAESVQQSWFPELTTTRAAARFENDGALQTYVELEAGGLPAFVGLLKQPFISPYVWEVRRFAESQEDELRVQFAPDGRAEGFSRKVPENAPGAALDATAAREIALAGARKWLGVDRVTAYAPQSASQAQRPGGRIDHTFVYEHSSETRGEARFRLRLVVAGDRLIEVAPYAFVPEAFDQRYKQLRNGNETIAGAASVAMFGLFGVAGVIVGGLWLTRRGAAQWRPAFAAGAVLGVLLAAAGLANMPMAWFGYATTDPSSTFVWRQVARAAVTAVGAALSLGTIFAVAEGLGRLAFAHHPRLFSAWRTEAAASWPLLGRTLGGYAWMAIELLLVAAFYLFARQSLGWWIPADALADPNVLGSWLPALGPIAQAAMAGTMEESLFRAIPLAGAALIGARLGWRRSAIAIALVVQALVFASAHANYPGLPAYSRVVELFFPALIWGVMYLRYGLVPCMIMHFTFDLVLMSLPIWVVADHSLWLDRGLIVLAGAAPLLMVLLARWRQGAFAPLPDALRNGIAPAVVPLAAAPAATTTAPRAPQTLPGWMRARPLAMLALVGATAAFYWLEPRPIDLPPIANDRAAAIATAEQTLAARGVVLDVGWKRTAFLRNVAADARDELRFVWREGGPDAFARLLGNALWHPHWQVTFRHADGAVEDRAEAWEVNVAGDGSILATEHRLPEGRPGARLEREAAEARARGVLNADPALAGRPWQLNEATSRERPARRDWKFIFEDRQRFDVAGGTARVAINVRGDETDAWQYTFVPDAWQRAQRAEQAARAPFGIAQGIALAAFGLLTLVVVMRQILSGPVRWRAALPWGALMLLAMLLNAWQFMDFTMLGIDTAQDWNTQLALRLAMQFIGFVISAALIGALVLRVETAVAQTTTATPRDTARDLLRALALVLVLGGVAAATRNVLPMRDAPLPNLALWSARAPALAIVVQQVLAVGKALAAAGLILALFDWATTRRRQIALGTLALLLAVLTVLAAESIDMGLWAVFSLTAVVLVIWQLLRARAVGVFVALLALMPLLAPMAMLDSPVAGATLLAGVAALSGIAALWWAMRRLSAQCAVSPRL